MAEKRVKQGDEGGRLLFPHYAVQDVSWQDPILKVDVDTKDDYLLLLRSEDDIQSASQ